MKPFPPDPPALFNPRRTLGVVLAGGGATRLGGVDKPLLRLGGQTIIAHVIARLEPQVGAIAISANGDPARYAHLNLPVFADDIPGRGPLGGVLRGLRWAASEGAAELLTVPGDTPFIPGDLAARLSSGPACAENGVGVHHPVALWPVSCAGALQDWLMSQKSGRVSAFAALIGMRRVWFNDLPDPFHNVNTPQDLAQARLLLAPREAVRPA